MALGLKINLSNSRLMGVGVNYEEVSWIAQVINSVEDKLSFTYLGVAFGSSMGNVESWSLVIKKYQNRLSD